MKAPFTRSPRRLLAALALLAAAWSGPSLAAAKVVKTAPAPDAGAATQPATPGTYIRVTEEANVDVALEVASRAFVPVDGTGPAVSLVGVAHIGERAFYRSLQEHLDAHDLVLYESVLPPGAGGAGGDTAVDRLASTRSAMELLAGLIELHRARGAAYPADLAALNAWFTRRDPRSAQWIDRAGTDAWGAAIAYDVEDADGSPTFRLTSLGADRAAGGEGEAADIVITAADGIPPLTLGSDDSLQAQLAGVLDLAFQLEAMDYGQPAWQCSDMAMDQVARAFEERGLDFGPLSSTLAGSSLPARAVKLLLRLVKFLDAFMDGAIADVGKLVLIEMLGDEALMEQSMTQMGAGFAEVIIDMRDQVVIDDLQALIERQPEVESVAIFYGAAHMPDMEERLVGQLGYRAVDATDAGAVTWFRAIELDLVRTAIPPAELKQIRGMMRQMMKQGMGR